MTTTNDKPGRHEQALLAIRQGAQKVLTTGRTVPYKGQSLDSNGLLALVDGFLAPIQTVRTDRATLNQDVATRRANAPAVDEFVRLFKASLAVTFGENSEEYVSFGFSKKVPAPLTPEQKQHKLEQLRATRAARGTLGPKARRAVKGVVGSGSGNAGSPAAPSPGATPSTDGADAGKT